MRIGFFGFCFRHENKGCEALTYAFVQMLVEIFGEESLEIDAFQISDLGKFREKFPTVKFVPKHLSIKRHPLKALSELKKCDVIFDVTWGDGFSDIYYKQYAARVILEKKWCILSGRPLILLPQTYGPFQDKRLEKSAMNVIRKSARVYSRDQLSADYIREKCGREAEVYTDMALCLPFQRWPEPSQKIRVGINVSGLLWNGGFHGDNQFGLTLDYPRYIKTLIEMLHQDDRLEIHLIPHVIETVEKALDGDVAVCEALHQQYPFTVLAPAFETALDAKNYISSMDVFTGARMHATIAAFSAEVPVIPFTYSRKFRGLYGNLNYPYLIEGNQGLSTEQAVEKTMEYIAERETLKEAAVESMEEVNRRLKDFMQSICMDLGR